MEAKEIKVDKIEPAYKHIILSGTCGPEVTVADIEKTQYHPEFGGRKAWVANGRWGAIRHTD